MSFLENVDHATFRVQDEGGLTATRTVAVTKCKIENSERLREIDASFALDADARATYDETVEGARRLRRRKKKDVMDLLLLYNTWTTRCTLNSTRFASLQNAFKARVGGVTQETIDICRSDVLNDIKQLGVVTERHKDFDEGHWIRVSEAGRAYHDAMHRVDAPLYVPSDIGYARFVVPTASFRNFYVRAREDGGDGSDVDDAPAMYHAIPETVSVLGNGDVVATLCGSCHRAFNAASVEHILEELETALDTETVRTRAQLKRRGWLLRAQRLHEAYSKRMERGELDTLLEPIADGDFVDEDDAGTESDSSVDEEEIGDGDGGGGAAAADGTPTKTPASDGGANEEEQDHSGEGSSVLATANDYYNVGAPIDSIAVGNDVGRRLVTARCGKQVDNTDIPDLERIAVAYIRLYVRAIKLVHTPSGIKGHRVEGCSITFAQHVHASGFGGFMLGDETLRAAVQNYRICLVDDEGHSSQLEKKALALDDLRLRPYVLWNLMMVMGRVPDEGLQHHAFAAWAENPQPVEEFQRLAANADVPNLLRQVVVHSTDTDLEDSVRPSDIARVRVDASGGAADFDDFDGSFPLSQVGVLPVASQSMSDVIHGIQKTVRGRTFADDEDEVPPNDNAAPDAGSAPQDTPPAARTLDPADEDVGKDDGEAESEDDDEGPARDGATSDDDDATADDDDDEVPFQDDGTPTGGVGSSDSESSMRDSPPTARTLDFADEDAGKGDCDEDEGPPARGGAGGDAGTRAGASRVFGTVDAGPPPTSAGKPPGATDVGPHAPLGLEPPPPQTTGDDTRCDKCDAPGDGLCLFHSHAWGLGRLGEAPQRIEGPELRNKLMGWVALHPKTSVYGTTLEEWVKWDSNTKVDAYTTSILNGKWGGGIEMAAFVHLYGVGVHVYERSSRGDGVFPFKRMARFDAPTDGAAAAQAAFVSILYDSGNHYNGLDPRLLKGYGASTAS
ncbi:hypothetical protein M885DRAFT_573764 [Pelagophyceae sp. CCMP2097]|nr:hypothetical protein M885DRAFT_573764 [Pelagophyceae sp. CCMP2097]